MEEEYGFVGETLYVYREKDIDLDKPFMTLVVTQLKLNETEHSVEVTLSGHLPNAEEQVDEEKSV